MIGLPKSTEFNRRIPKQKFYENISVTPALRRIFIDQIKVIYWRNKIAPSTMNLEAGLNVTEIEVFEVKLNSAPLDVSVLRQMDKEIPYHIVFLLEFEDKYQAWTAYKEKAGSGSNVFKVDTYYHDNQAIEESPDFENDNWNIVFAGWSTNPAATKPDETGASRDAIYCQRERISYDERGRIEGNVCAAHRGKNIRGMDARVLRAQI